MSGGCCLFHTLLDVDDVDDVDDVEDVTLFLFAIDGTAEDELQHPAQLCGVAVLADQIDVGQGEVIDLLTQDLHEEGCR